LLINVFGVEDLPKILLGGPNCKLTAISSVNFKRFIGEGVPIVRIFRLWATLEGG